MMKEYGDKLYGVTTYFLSKSLIELPVSFFIPLLFCSIVYFAVGLEDGFENFIFFTFTVIILVYAGSSLGMFMSSVLKKSADMLAPVVMLPFILFGGFMTNAGAFPDYISWF